MARERPIADLSSLRLLVAVGHHGSLGRVAKREGISQPAAGKRIAALEQALGLRLIQRSSQGSSLTSDGLVIADRAQRVLEEFDQFIGEADRLRRRMDVDLAVAASHTVADHLLAGWLFELRQRGSRLNVSLRVTNSQDVQAMVRRCEVNLGFVDSLSVDPDLSSQCVGSDHLSVVVPPSHSWARLETPVSRKDLVTVHVVARERGSGSREALDGILQRDHMNDMDRLIEFESNTAVRQAVISGVGAGVLSSLAVTDDLMAGHLVEVPLAGPPVILSLSAVWLGQLSPAAALLLEVSARVAHMCD